MTKLKSVLLGFEGFAKLDLNKPIKLLPTGTWFRDDRELDITPQRLQEMVKNFKGGLPNFRVGINLDHADNQGKVGDITDVAYLADGPGGPGLYATEYDLRPNGIAAVEDDGYDGVSAEVVWTLNYGANYQDPSTGEEHDNVLVGVALTPYPYFGHGEMALYHTDRGEVPHEVYHCDVVEVYLPYGGAVSFAEFEQWRDAQDVVRRAEQVTHVFEQLLHNIMHDEDSPMAGKLVAIQSLTKEFEGMLASDAEVFESEYFRKFSPEKRKQLAKAGKALPDGSYPIVTVGDLKNAIQAIGRAKNRAAAIRHIKKRARALGKTELLPDDWAQAQDEEVPMSVLDNIREALAPITARITAGEVDPAEVVEELGDKAAVELLGIEALMLDPAELAEAEVVDLTGEEDEPGKPSPDEPEAEPEALTADNLVEELAAQRVKTEELEAQLNSERLTRRKGELETEAGAFKALPFEVEEFVEKVMALEDLSPELAEWLREKLGAIDVAMVEAGLLRELGSELEADLSDTDRFLKIVDTIIIEEFEGDKGRYSDALTRASERHPKLAEAYAVR